MPKTAVPLDKKQVETLFRQLSLQDKRRLAHEVVSEQFLEGVRKFRSMAKRYKLSSRRINTMVEETREVFHAKSRR
jgi:hypothetical protein